MRFLLSILALALPWVGLAASAAVPAVSCLGADDGGDFNAETVFDHDDLAMGD